MIKGGIFGPDGSIAENAVALGSSWPVSTKPWGWTCWFQCTVWYY